MEFQPSKPKKTFRIDLDVWEKLKEIQIEFSKRYVDTKFESAAEARSLTSLSQVLREIIAVYEIVQTVKKEYSLPSPEIEIAKDMAIKYAQILEKQYKLKRGGL